jgi:thioredoxin
MKMNIVFTVLAMLLAFNSLFSETQSNDATLESLSAADFEQALQISEYMIVYFYVAGCKCSESMNPLLQKMAEKYVNIYFAKMEGGAEETISKQYQVTAFPTLLFFNNGEYVSKWVGVINEKKLESKIQAFLLSD